MEEQQAPSGGAAAAAPKSRALWIVVAVVVVVVVVLAAAVLGGLFTPARPNLRIGSLLSLTGSLDDFGPGNTKGVQLAVEQINAAGGVLGRPVELFSEDDQTLPAAASAATTKLITTNRVNAIVGAQFSGGTIASLTPAKANGVPMVSPSATSPSLSNLTLTGGWFYRTTPNDNLQGVVAAQYLYTNRSFRHIAIMHINDPYGNGLAGVLKAKFLSFGGTTVNQTIPINPAATTFTTELGQLFSQNPQAVYFIAFTNEGFTVLREWQQGLSGNPSWNRPWVLAEGMRSQVFLDQLRTSAGIDVRALEGTAPITGFGNVYATFESQYKARFFNQTPVLYTDNAYDAAYVIALAAQKAGAVDGASIRRELRNVASPPGTVILPGEWSKAVAEIAAGRDINWEGAAGSENFDANGDVTGPYEIWGANATNRLVRIAFIPESLIQPSPPAPLGASSLPLSSQFLVKVQAIGSSRWD